MSDREPDGPYIYQPFAVNDRVRGSTGRLFAVGGLSPDTTIAGLTKPEAEACCFVLRGLTAPRLTADDVAHGGARETPRCEACNGTGEIEVSRPCSPSEATGGMSELTGVVRCESCEGTGSAPSSAEPNITGRLVLNAYGRKCYNAGLAKAESALADARRERGAAIKRADDLQLSLLHAIQESVERRTNEIVLESERDQSRADRDALFSSNRQLHETNLTLMADRDHARTERDVLQFAADERDVLLPLVKEVAALRAEVAALRGQIVKAREWYHAQGDAFVDWFGLDEILSLPQAPTGEAPHGDGGVR